jgi:hypothetical protein
VVRCAAPDQAGDTNKTSCARTHQRGSVKLPTARRRL